VRCGKLGQDLGDRSGPRSASNSPDWAKIAAVYDALAAIHAVRLDLNRVVAVGPQEASRHAFHHAAALTLNNRVGTVMLERASSRSSHAPPPSCEGHER
jgi:predicted RNA polymerase sigma factor